MSGADRPRLLLFTCRQSFAPKNAIAATLAWMTEERGWLFEVYYDSPRSGRHFGGGNGSDVASMAGGLVVGGRHLETLVSAAHRFRITALAAGPAALTGTLEALAGEGAVELIQTGEDLVGIYREGLTVLGQPPPDRILVVDASPMPGLEGSDAYAWPEIFHRRALGVEAGVQREHLCELATSARIEKLDLAEPGDDFAAFTARLARRWADKRRGWLLADPVLASSWLPTACRERLAVVYGAPQARVIQLLGPELSGDAGNAILGRQYDDGDFLALSRLGHSLQLVDPGRPPLPVMLTRRRRFPPDLPDPSAHDPTDAELARYAAEGRILVSLLFWSGMLREIENLYAVCDLAALTGVKAGLVLTAASLAYWPSPLDLLAVPAERGGVYPQLEVLLGSCGDGAAIESAMPKDRLRDHLAAASRRLDELGLPAAWRPRGWWPTLDAELVSRPRWQAAAPVAWNHSARYRLEILYRADRGNGNGHSGDGLRSRLSNEARRALRQTALKPLFRGRRPFDGFRPGPLDEGVARMVRSAGFSYMFTKAGFGDPPHVAYRDGDFVALNHTAGQWDGWTPFETVSGVGDLRRAEARLLGRRRPGWLVGTIDTCLWALSGELWRAAPGLAAIARFAAEGGTSGRLVNVRPAVLARYARLIAAAGQATGSQAARVALR